MDQIQVLVEQRMNKINEISRKIKDFQNMRLDELQNEKNRHRQIKNKLKQQQKMRIQKQNWIINILRSIKYFSNQKKKQFIYQSSKIMAKFQNLQLSQIINQSEIQINFTQQFVNLYAIFFDKLTQKFQFKVPIKQIIRPNNRTIITDLIKYLVQFTRDYFKEILAKLKNVLYPQNQVLIDNNSIFYPIKTQKHDKIKQKLRNQSQNQSKQLIKEALNKHKKILTNEQLLNIQDNKVKINYKQLKIKEIEQAVIENFINLKDKNLIIKNTIQNWRNTTFGMQIDQKNLMYNFTNLYTKDQIQAIQSKYWHQKQIGLANPNCKSTSKLKEFWKQKIKYQMDKQRLIRKQKIVPINKKLNFVIQLKYDHKSPLEVVLIEKFHHINHNNLPQFLKSTKPKQSSNDKIKKSQQQTQKIKDIQFKLAQKQRYRYQKPKSQKIKSQLILPSINKKITSYMNQICQYEGTNTKTQQNHQSQKLNYSRKSVRSKSTMKTYNYDKQIENKMIKKQNFAKISVGLVKLVNLSIK